MVLRILKSESGIRQGLAVAVVASILCACGGTYQAPVAERSEVSDRQAPVIVTNSDDSPSRYGARNSSAGSAVRPVVQVRPPSRQPTDNHQVTRGETLYSIAFQHDLDYRTLAIANNLSPPYTIFVGQQLTLNLNQPAAAPAPIANAAVAAGTVVNNNAVAQAQAATPVSRSVIRQPIVSTPVAEPRWQWPVRGQLMAGFQTDSSNGKGIDIAASSGQPVVAAADGDVVYAGNGIQGSGNLIIIRHNERLLSAYAHNRNLLVVEGARIRAGDTIGEVGINTSGQSVLHFEIRQDGKPVDPLQFLPAM